MAKGKKKGGKKRNVNSKSPAPNNKNSNKDIVASPITKATTTIELPIGIKNFISNVTPSQKILIESLCTAESNQKHLFENWSSDNDKDKESKIEFINQLETLDSSYNDGGICGYIKNASKLLEDSSKGVNPYEGYNVEIPEGAKDRFGEDVYCELEKIGLEEMKYVGFVLVAGGLGERLGYKGIKIELPMDISSDQTYLEYYIGTMQSYQRKYGEDGIKLPLCIMTSKDTHDKTIALLEKKDWFGMKEEITIVQQGMGVPAIQDGDGKIALDPENAYKIWTKPHGHGDIHALLHSNNIAKNWLDKGLKYIVLFQDTNGLAFHTLPYVLGVSKKRGFVMNSVAVPRKAGQAIGGITKLVKENKQRTINVEYNQLKNLLKSGDVNDETTGYSPFPGNINQLLFELSSYVETLEQSKGMVPEFVNPKYQPNSNTFKSPTRLECMMQDFPLLYSETYSSKVGFTQVPTSLSFSPVKNTISEGVKLQEKNVAPAVAASAEADQHTATRQILRTLGCLVEDHSETEFQGIKVIPGPKIILYPSFVCSFHDYKETFINPTKVVISANSTLIVKGENIKIDSLALDGTLIIEIESGVENVVIQGLVVNNKGWKYASAPDSDDDIIRMRGYSVDKVETKVIHIFKDGRREEKTIGYTDTKTEPVSEVTDVAAKIAAEDKLAMEMLDGVSDSLDEAQKVTPQEDPKEKPKTPMTAEERLSSKRAEIEAKVQMELKKREKMDEVQNQEEEERLAVKRAEIERKVQEEITRRKKKERLRKLEEEQALKKAKEEKLAAEKKAQVMKEAVEAAKKEEEEKVAKEKKEEKDRLAKKEEAEKLVAEAAKNKEEERLAVEAEKKAAQERIAAEKKEEERLAAEAKKKEEEKLAAEAAKKAEEEIIAVAKKEEEERIEAERIATEKKAEEDRISAEKKAEEDRIAIEKKTEEDRIAAEKKAEEEKKAEDQETKEIVEEETNLKSSSENAQDNPIDMVDEKSAFTAEESPQKSPKSIVDDPCDAVSTGCGCIIN